ncbi:hypothetical protein ACFCY9_12325 [Streptomyces fimicarius]|uniref:hypothetical protein n=1 Tax=Streptomyces griseus TaxID=1911 RepID=UPI0035D9944A
MIHARLRVYLLAIAAGLLIAVIFTLSVNGMVAQAITISLVVPVLADASEYLATERRQAATAAQYRERALLAEAAVRRVREYRGIAPADAQGPTWAALELALDGQAPADVPPYRR